MNISIGLWAISTISMPIGIFLCSLGLRGILRNIIYKQIALGVFEILFCSILAYFWYSDYSNDVSDWFRDKFIVREDLVRPLAWAESYTTLPTFDNLYAIPSALRTFVQLDYLAVFGSILLIYLGTSLVSANLAVREPTEDYLRAIRGGIRYSLFAMGTVLTLGVLSESSLHHWGLLFARPYESCLQTVVGELRTFIGVSYAISIGSAFAPAFMIWLYRVNALSKTAAATKAVSTAEWRRTSELDLTPLEFARSFVAVVLPAVLPNALDFLSKIPL